MGLFRVFLAVAVLISHLGLPAKTLLVTGPVAVQIFYVVSGFYMGLVLNERYNRPALNRVFYVNRLARIFPVYLAFLALHLTVFGLLQWRGGDSPFWPYLQDTVSPLEKVFLGVLNLTVVGQDIPFFLGIDHGHLAYSDNPFRQHGHEVFHFMVIPPAWSLALELYFYALAPFIVRRPVWQIASIAAVSFGARIVAKLYGLTVDPFNYRFFPFELSTFLLGVLAYKAWASSPASWRDRRAAVPVVAALAAIVFYPRLLGTWSELPFFTPVRIGTLVLCACALPALHERSRTWRLDRKVGELSFPVYLCHLLVIGLFPRVGVLAEYPALQAVLVIAITLLLSWFVVRFVERGVERWRRRNAALAGAVDEPLPNEERSEAGAALASPFHLPACQGRVAA